jgi:uncharacterized protein YutE (UPF0331/DUF86 family)
MDRCVIDEKLEALRQCALRLERKRPVSADALAADQDAQDILALNLIHAVQLCVDIATHIISDADAELPATMGESFDALVRLKVVDAALAARMKKSVGFRNIAVHSYRAVDWSSGR